MASADPIEDDVDDALRRDSSRRDRASPDPAGAEQEKSGRYPPAAVAWTRASARTLQAYICSRPVAADFICPAKRYHCSSSELLG